MSEIKTDFEKLVIAKQYIRYQKKRIQELEDKLHENLLLVEELKLYKIFSGKERKIIEFKDQFHDRFVNIDVDYGNEIKEYVKNEIEPKALDNLLHLYHVLNKTKLRVIKRGLKSYYAGEKVNIGKFVFAQQS